MLQGVLTSMEGWSLTTAIVSNNFLYFLTLSLHLAGMAILVGCITFIDCRLLGVAGRQIPTEAMLRALLPCVWAAFLLAFVTGALLFPPQATRYAQNPVFLAKMSLLLVAGANVLGFQLLAVRGGGSRPKSVKVIACISIVVWVAIAAAGRLIPYV